MFVCKYHIKCFYLYFYVSTYIHIYIYISLTYISYVYIYICVCVSIFVYIRLSYIHKQLQTYIDPPDFQLPHYHRHRKRRRWHWPRWGPRIGPCRSAPGPRATKTPPGDPQMWRPRRDGGQTSIRPAAGARGDILRVHGMGENWWKVDELFGKSAT